MKHALYLTLIATVAACSSNPSSTPSNCPDGQTHNPVTGECATPSSNNGGTEADTGTSPADTGGTSTDTGNGGREDLGTPTRDMGRIVDMSKGRDMGTVVENGIRFVAIGDTGEGNDKQREVGQSIGNVCTQLGGCDFGLLLGDNVYDSGVSSTDDLLWMSMFEIPYGHLPFPFYAVLGNHDLGGDGLGVDLDPDKADYQIGYSMVNPMWNMPARYYDFSAGPVHFVALDTTAIFFGQDDNQRDDVPGLIANAQGRWKVAFGHHPYYSNGPHGNAGEYEGLPFIPIANGEHVQSFVEDRICGEVDFYLCGHDHSRQDLVPDCAGTQFIVSGAGAKTTDLEGDNPTHFEADTEGFLLVEATDTTFKIQFYDAAGTLEHERTVTR